MGELRVMLRGPSPSPPKPGPPLAWGKRTAAHAAHLEDEVRTLKSQLSALESQLSTQQELNRSLQKTVTEQEKTIAEQNVRLEKGDAASGGRLGVIRSLKQENASLKERLRESQAKEELKEAEWSRLFSSPEYKALLAQAGIAR